MTWVLSYDIRHDMARSCCMTWVPCWWGRCRRARRRRCEGYRSSNNSTRPDAATAAAEARTPNKAADKRRGCNVHIIISIAVFTYWLSTDSDLKGASISYHTLLFLGRRGINIWSCVNTWLSNSTTMNMAKTRIEGAAGGRACILLRGTDMKSQTDRMSRCCQWYPQS